MHSDVNRIQKRSPMAVATHSPAIAIASAPADPLANQPAVQWAIAQLTDALTSRSIAVHRCEQIADAPGASHHILISAAKTDAARQILDNARISVSDRPESLALVSARNITLTCGSDARGLIYAILELADRVVHAENPMELLILSDPVSETPANEIRSIARYFTSDVEDKAWFHDKAFWKNYLSMLIARRFNRFSLSLGLGYNFPRNVSDVYFYFAYPYLLSVPGYDVRVSNLPDEERDRNMAMLRHISEETVARGLNFQLALWTHAFEWVESPEANAVITGLTPENHAAYCRDALKQLLVSCPNISGLTFRVHGESGVPEQSYDFWQTVFDGIVQCGRPVEIDMHAKGLDQNMIDVAQNTGMPVVISPKYWAEHQALPYHQAAIRDLEQSRKEGQAFMAFSAGTRRFLRYSYGDLLRENRPYGILYRIWPGTQRLLLWGDPAMAAGLGRYANFCGSQGMELCEPLTFKGRMGSGLPGGREGYADPSLRTDGGDWEKYDYTYRLIGRLLYNPDADPDTWRRHLQKHHGPAAQPLENALAHASRILPLITLAHHPSASNNAYWPEIYTNMPIVSAQRPHPYRDTPEPRLFSAVSPLDPAMFSSIEEFVSETIAAEPSARYSPLQVAHWLETLAETAETELKKAEMQSPDPSAPAHRRIAIDVAIQAGIGRFFAEKLRAGVSYTLSQRTRNRQPLQRALAAYQRARAAWATLAQTASAYVSDLTFGRAAHLRGHWSDRLSAIDADIQDMADKRNAMGDTAHPRDEPDALEVPPSPDDVCSHTPPSTFRKGDAISLELAVSNAQQPIAAVRVHYRRVDQSESHVIADMKKSEGKYLAAIPPDYTDTPYPLQYWFELRDASGHAWFWPGLAPDLSNQPYFVLRQVAS